MGSFQLRADPAIDEDLGDSDALEALSVLGYSLEDARTVLKSIPSDISGTEQRVRAALRMLGKK